MSKKRTSVSIDEELFERLQMDDHLNVSGLFNEFVRDYYETGAVTGLEKRLDRVEAELEAARAQVDRLENERDRVIERMEVRQDNRKEKMEDVLENLNLDPGKATEENPAIQTQAQKIGVPPDVLAERYQEENQSSSELSFASSSR